MDMTSVAPIDSDEEKPLKKKDAIKSDHTLKTENWCAEDLERYNETMLKMQAMKHLLTLIFLQQSMCVKSQLKRAFVLYLELGDKK